MERFEDRLLLSINPTGLDDDFVWNHTLDRAIERAADLGRYGEETLAGVDSWVVGLSDGFLAAETAAVVGADSLAKAPYLPSSYIWQFPAEAGWEDAAAALNLAEGVKQFYPLIRQDRERKSLPDDSLFSEQWHLDNTGTNSNGGTPGADANVDPVWDFATGTGLGSGVVIGIVDDGLEHTHEDLVNQYRADLSYDFNFNDPDPFPDDPLAPFIFDDHGTAVAGVAAAEGDNGLGVSGAAPGAELAGLRLLATAASDADEASALAYLMDEIDVYNNSWGAPDGAGLDGPGPMTLAALQDGVTNGRAGLGSIYTFAGGNGLQFQDDVNYDGYANSRFTIAVAAIDHNGVQSYYSEPGACLLVSAYSDNWVEGITTTDRTGAIGYDPGDYTQDFGGTSSATPLVSGVIALMLEANPNLTWRDVQHILVESSAMTDPGDLDWTTNAAGYDINHKYGFGAIDAEAAVRLARTWNPVLPEEAVPSGVMTVNATVPDGDLMGITSTIAMPTGLTSVEWVEVTIDATHTNPGDLEVVLISPGGTRSILAEPHFDPSGSQYSAWTFTTARNWGEWGEGDWTLQVRDLSTGNIGTFNWWELTTYGQIDPGAGPQLVSIIPNEGALLQDGEILHIAPQELTFRFNEGQIIDPNTLGAIEIIRSGGDNVFGNANDVPVPYGWIGIGERPNEVVVRFAETLPDDLYRISITGSGLGALLNMRGIPFNQGEDMVIQFELDLGAQVIAVVPQPMSRGDTGQLQQARDRIVVYFNDDALNLASAQNTDFYQLIHTNETADTNDDVVHNPVDVVYLRTENKAILTFADDLDQLGTGAFRLRIGNEYRPITTSLSAIEEDAGSGFGTAHDVTDGLRPAGAGLDGHSVILSGTTIEPTPWDWFYTLEWPGATDEPGHREMPDYAPVSGEDHYLLNGDVGDRVPGTTTLYYNFRDDYGFDPYGNPLHNIITPTQMNRARDVLELLGDYVGVQFVETFPETGEDTGAFNFTIATGDLRSLAPAIQPGTAAGLAGTSANFNGDPIPLAVMSASVDWGTSAYGVGWFTTAMHEIMHLMMFGHTYDQPPLTIMGSAEEGTYLLTGLIEYTTTSGLGTQYEPVFPGDHDIVHGQHLYRPDSNDIDLYSFTLDVAGRFRAETVAERLEASSMLDTVLTLFEEYEVEGQGGQPVIKRRVIARNDDYYSEDSRVEQYLEPGKYYIGVTSTGNDDYDPIIENSGVGGTSQGQYELRLDFAPEVSDHLIDATGTLFDGDADGVPGGVYNFWFNVVNDERVADEPTMIFVDKVAAGPTPDGTLANPYNTIKVALDAAEPGDIVRIVGNWDTTAFMDQLNFDAGQEPRAVALADLDGDGALDLVTANARDDNLTVLLGSGNGTFPAAVAYDVGNEPLSVAVGDVNDDGVLDLVTANSRDNNVSVLLGNGNGTFGVGVTYGVGEEPYSAALADFNGDGDPDVVTADGYGDTVSVLLNYGDGTFAPRVAYAVGAEPYRVASDDLDGDGAADIVATNRNDDTISVLLGNGDGTFQDQTAYPVGQEPHGVVLGDLNGDRVPDMVVANRSDDNVSVLLGNGDGTFQAQAVYPAAQEPVAAAIGDMDGDTVPDLVVAGSRDNIVSILMGNGDGTFVAGVTYDVGEEPSSVALGDLDGDGATDIVTANAESDDVSVLLRGRDLAYEIGYDVFNTALPDGSRMEIPRGVTVMIDAGAIFKLRNANIDVGSSAVGVTGGPLDRSLGALQVLGTPERSVYFTSYHNEAIGVDGEPDRATVPEKGDWGGLVFRNDLDRAYADRVILEEEGIFLNYVNHADMTYGGGEVMVNSIRNTYTPIHMVEARPTVSWNTITLSADAAMSGDPNSFEDSKFQGNLFTADYDRVGPDIHGNHLVDNTVNGIFVRIRTRAGKPMDELEVTARFDDRDIVHLVAENLQINGTPGGPELRRGPSALTVLDTHRIQAVPGANFIDVQTFSISDAYTSVLFEFENLFIGNGLVAGDMAVGFNTTDTAAQIATAVASAINQANVDLALNVTATAEGTVVVLQGPVIRFDGLTNREARTDARLAIDPGIVVKMDGARIETELGAQFIAEGLPGYPVIFTSLLDARYGAGGTFATAEDPAGTGPSGGDWAGLYFGPISRASIDYALISHAGGVTAIEGDFDLFNPVEIHQATARITHSRLDDNAGGGGGDRNGRGASVPSTIFVRGAQPVIADNLIRRNEGPAISIDANSLNSFHVTDWGRTTGGLQAVKRYADNLGPLILGNRLADDGLNGMLVRGGVLTTQTVWDDTDIVHVLLDEIVIPNHHTYGGLRLQSSATKNLVVKLSGANAGFTALGVAEEINDRLGGTLQIVGAPGHPVVLTSLADDSYGAGLDPRDMPQNNTDNVDALPQPGDWRSVKLEKYVNDRNVAVVHELEEAYGADKDVNANPLDAQYVGSLSGVDKGGDDNLRLGFEIHGFIRLDDRKDVDVYSFEAPAGTEVWLDIDRTRHALDTIVELVDADGLVLASSQDSFAEQNALAAPTGLGMTMDRDLWVTKDYNSTNPRDAGMRLILPGPKDEVRTFYVRVRSTGALTQGNYQLQVRLRELQEVPGSAVRHANIHYATNGIELLGLPTHSPLLAETAEVEGGTPFGAWTVIQPGGPNNDIFVIANTPGPAFNGVDIVLVQGATTGNQALVTFDANANTLTIAIDPVATTAGTVEQAILNEGTFSARLNRVTEPTTDGSGTFPTLGVVATTAGGTTGGADNNTFGNARSIGNLLASDRNTLQVAGSLSGPGDIDWYRFSMDHEFISQFSDVGSFWSTIFDIDYADGMERPDTNIWVFDSIGNLIYAGQDSNVVDDRPGPLEGADLDNLLRGTVGAFDPYIGPVHLYEGNALDYYVAITGEDRVPATLSQPLARLEPIDALNRIAEDHIGYTDNSLIAGPPTQPVFPGNSSSQLNLAADDFHLGDVTLYVSTDCDLITADPFTGAFETDVTHYEVVTDYLPDSWPIPGTVLLSYGDIAMRNDGQLYTFTRKSTRAWTDRNAWAGHYRQLDTGDAKILQHDEDDDIVTYMIDRNGPPALEVMGDDRNEPGGIDFEAMIHGLGNRDRGILAVGNAPDLSPSRYVTNLVYRFDDDGNAIDHPHSDGGARLPTDVVPLARLLTGVTIIATDATDLATPFLGDILDGSVILIEDENGNILRFEFDSGPDVRTDPTGPRAVRDGETFMLDGGTNRAIFEFDSGPVLVFGDGTTLSDGDTFTIQDDTLPPNQNPPVTFELNDVSLPAGDPNAGVTGTNIAVGFAPADPPLAVVGSMVAAINGAGFAVVASGHVPGGATGTEGRVSLENDVQIQLGGVSIILEGDYGQEDPNHVAIPFEETMPEANVYDAQGNLVQTGFGEAIATVVEIAVPEIVVSYADRLQTTPTDPGDRLTFYHAVDFAFGASAASITVDPPGQNNAVVIMADVAGPEFNGVDVVFVNTSGLGNNANLTWAPGPGTPPVGGTLTIEVDPAATTAQTLVDALNNDPAVPFGASLDNSDTTRPPSDGSGVMLVVGNVGQTFGGTTGVPSFTHWRGAHRPASLYGIAPTSNADIPFRAGDTWEEIADKIVAAINKANVDFNPNFVTKANAYGDAITLDFVTNAQIDPEPPSERSPLTVQGEGPGGLITGMTWVGGTLYAVSDAGGLYEIIVPNPNILNDYLSNYALRPYPIPGPPYNDVPPPDTSPEVWPTGGGIGLRYIPTSEGLVGTRFSGLTVGPQNVEGGRYANTLFATTDYGDLYAFTPDGILEPIFLNGASSIPLDLPTAIGPVTGLDFSPVDYNLWHVTNYRWDEPGHGINIAPDGSRNPPTYRIVGGTSFYFGLEDPRAGTTISYQPGAGNFIYTNPAAFQTYDMPGGAHGSLTTETFSLVGYNSADQPTLYYTYYLNKGGPTFFDSARVFVSADGANWTRVSDLGDSGGDWRQARINLSGWVGQDNLRIRFDFATAGDMEVGPPQDYVNSKFLDPYSGWLTGTYLQALPGIELHDGDGFTFADPLSGNSQRFEFNLGHELYVPNVGGAQLPDGEWFSVEDSIGQVVTFEFDKDGSLTVGDVAITILETDTTSEVVQNIVDTIRASNLAGVTVYLDFDEQEVTLQGAVDVQLSPGPQMALLGDGAATAPGATAVNISPYSNAQSPVTAVLDASVDLDNDGTGLVGTIGPLGTAAPGGVIIPLPGNDNDLLVNVLSWEPALQAVRIVTVNVLAVGDQAIATFNPQTGTLTLDIDPAATTANTLVREINGVAHTMAFAVDQVFSGSRQIQTFDAPTALAWALIDPTGVNNDFLLTAATPGPGLGGVDIIFVNTAAVGDQALVNFDPGARTLTIDVDPTATTANTVIAEINLEGTFLAGLDFTADPTNDGSGLITDAGVMGTTALPQTLDGQTFSISDGTVTLVFEFEDVSVADGVAAGNYPVPYAPGDLAGAIALAVVAALDAANSASATVALPGDNNDLRVIAATPGPGLEGVDIIFDSVAATGDQALVAYDPVAGTLTIDIDPTATTANTVVAEITAQGTFAAVLDTTVDVGNDGTGLIGITGTMGMTAAPAPGGDATLILAGNNNDFAISPVTPGPDFEGVSVIFENTAATGDQALVTFDAVAGTLTIDVDPTATTANTVVAEINAGGIFTAVLDSTVDIGNDGTGLIDALGIVGATSLGAYLNVTATAMADIVTLDGPIVLFDAGTSPLMPLAVDDLAMFTSLKVDGDLIHVIGYDVGSGPLPYGTNLPGDRPPPNPAFPYDRFHHYFRGQDNVYEGFYVDDLIIGFRERGEMLTGVTPETGFNAVNPGLAILTGAYQLEIRRGTDFGMGLYRAWDTNDRLMGGLTMLALDADDVEHEQTFTVSDGVHDVTFEFLDPGVAGGGHGLPIYFTGGETAAQMANLIVQEINRTSGLDVTAVSILTSERVDLFGAAWAEGLPTTVFDNDFTSPTSMALVDLNADMILDIVTSNEDTNTVSVLLGLGGGAFAAPLIYEVGPLPSSVEVADLNGDMIPDIAVANAGNTTVSVLFGLGDGTFDAQKFYDVGALPESIALSDFNGDLIPDIVTTNYWDDTLSVLLNQGDGTFAFLDFVDAGDGPLGIRIDDLDADGAMDLAVTNANSHSMSVLFGAGDGTFPDEETVQVGRFPSAVAIADVTGDGIPDLVIANEFDSTVSVLANNGDRTFMEQEVYGVGGGPADVEVADVNNDGFLDIVTANYWDDHISVLLGEGGGTFTNQEESPVYEFPYYPVDRGAVDLELGPVVGQLDVVTCNYTVSTVSVLRNRVGGAFMYWLPAIVGDHTLEVIQGDQNLDRDQGQVVIESNQIMHSASYGIVFDASARDGGTANLPHPSSVAPLREINTSRLVPGVMIENNLIAFGGQGGIFFSGDPNAAGTPTAAVPFGRIVNNTIYGGVDVTPPSLPPVTLVAAGPQVLMSGIDSDLQSYTDVGPNDDLSSAAVNLGFTFEFYGSNYTQFYINNNGNVTFTGPFASFWPQGFPQMTPIVAPFWADVDTRPDAVTTNPGGEVHLAQGTTPGGNPFVQIDWVDVGYYDQHADLLNSFTLYIEDDPAGDLVAFAYQDLEWTTGESDWFFVNGFGGSGAQIGFDAGNGSNFISVMRPNSPSDLAALLAQGQYVFRIDPTTGIPIGGAGTGITVTENASPTLLNNIVAQLDVGIQVDATSTSTVIGGTVYQNNASNTAGIGVGSFPALLTPGQPLFVDPENGNFYLDKGSPAIDSSINSLEDRPAQTSVKDPLGIPPSPILAPELDLYGQLRADDPAVAPPPGLGYNVFKDRGALDRIDFFGPSVELVNPLDNDTEEIDRNPALHDVFIAGQNLFDFSMRLLDYNGTGIDDNTVTSTAVELWRDGIRLTEGLDYIFSYDATNDVIRLIPAAGVWINGSIYEIVLDNSTSGIRDRANNPLSPNRPGGETTFNISLSGLDYGDAPDGPYPSLAENDGARHIVITGYQLGARVSNEPDARQNATATGDQYDDGVVFATDALLMNATADVTVTATGGDGFLDAWIDFNQDGVWDDASEKIFNSLPLAEGDNPLSFPTPAISFPPGVTRLDTFARFRFSSEGGLGVTGEAEDGEVEDYQVVMVEHFHDLGDAPDPTYPTLTTNNGAQHRLGSGLFLGPNVDAELEGQPNAAATGDDDDGTDDEDGVVFLSPLVVGRQVDLIVTASSGSGVLNAWIDFNYDGDWEDAGEQVFVNTPLSAGDNPLSFAVPDDAAEGETTFARFRLSTQPDLSFDGLAFDGEVEDYAVDLTAAPQDFGDAPDPNYPTLLASNGARHEVVAGFQLGATVDFESDGQPNITATGDDMADDDDEDGVTFNDFLIPGNDVTITVNASADDGYLNAWIDFNGDGDWDDPGEQIFSDEPLAAGDNVRTISVPEDLDAVTTFARFRYSHTAGLPYDGPAAGELPPDGEVEDYRVEIVVGDSTISGFKFDDRNANGEWNQDPTSAAPQFTLVPPGPAIMAPNDDGSSAVQNFGFVFEFFGNNYTQFYINNNGNITFDTPLLAFTSSAFPQSVPMVAPFWADVDTRPPSGGSVRLAQGITGSGHPFIQVDWVGVGYFMQNTDRLDTFTLYIEDDPAGDVVAMVYHDMQWTTGDASGGFGGFGGMGAQLGFDAGDGVNYISLGRPSTAADLAALMAIGQYAFRFDPTTGMPGGGAEPGLAGVTVYLDLNDDGQLNVDQFGVPAEPFFITMEDDLATPGVDETGYYEFTQLFAGDYTVREIVPEGWIQTYPDQDGVTLPNGAVTHYVQDPEPEGWYTVALPPGTLVEDVNFGNYKVGHLTISDAAIAEGDWGTTELELTIHLTDSFGAPITVDFATQDGTATVADNDYQPASGTITFTPTSVPRAPWVLTTLTSNVSNDYDYHVSGSKVVWEGFDGIDWEIFLWDGEQTIRLTDNNRDDRFAFVRGDHVVWSGFDGNDDEIFLFDYDQFRNNGATIEEATTQLTNNNFNDKNPRASASAVTWWAEQPDDFEIYYYDIKNGGPPTNISNNDSHDYDPRISGSNVVWYGEDGIDQEIFLYDGTTTIQLTDNLTTDRRPQINGQNVVWEGHDGSDYEVFVYQIDLGTTTQITTNDYNDKDPRVSGQNVVWNGYDGSDWEIYYYHVTAGGTPTNLSNDVYLNAQPRIEGNRVVWHTQPVTGSENWEVYFYEIGTGQAPSNVSSNLAYDWYPQVSDSLVVWRSYDGDDYEIVVAALGEPEVTETITLLINGDLRLEPDETFLVNLSNAVFAEIDDDQAVAAILNDDGAMDYGDAPDSVNDPGYPTLLANNGARHVMVPGYRLGAALDAEGDGQPNAAATGDDERTSDDEDGVTLTPMLQGSAATVTVNASAPGMLDAWIDFNADGDWDDPGEQVFTSEPLTAGSNLLSIDVLPSAVVGTTFARFRFSSTGGLSSTGNAPDGEVEDYSVEIGSNVSLLNGTLTVAGTGQDDVFELTVGEVYKVVMNGSEYQYLAAEVDNVVFDGGAGNDTAILNGSDGDETVELWAGTGRLVGDGLLVNVSSAETISTTGGPGGHDVVTFYDSVDSDTFVGWPNGGMLTGHGAANDAGGFDEVFAYSTRGGRDEAKIYDSPAQDMFVGTPTYARLYGEGFSVQAEFFAAVHIFATAGGFDTAKLYDSAGDDNFAGKPVESALWNDAYYVRMKYFEAVHAYSTAGGYDVAHLYDSNGHDTFYGTPTEAALFNDGFFNRAKGFNGVYAHATGGFDVAKFFDSPGDDWFVGAPTYAGMYTIGLPYYNRAMHFEQAHAYGTAGGFDVAKFFDSPGDDFFYADATHGAVFNNNFYNRAKFFDNVHAYATAGGYDVAELHGSSSDDTFYSDAIHGAMWGNGWYNRAKHFEEVNAYNGQGGVDKAYLNDSAMNDLLEVEGNSAKLSNESLKFTYAVYDFPYVKATSSNSGDTKRVSTTIDFLLETEGLWADD